MNLTRPARAGFFQFPYFMANMKIFTFLTKSLVALYPLASLSAFFSLSAQSPTNITDPGETVYYVEYRLRNGKTGFEAALYTPSTPAPGDPGGGEWQLDPPGAPVWNTPPNSWGDVFNCSYQYNPDSGKSVFQVDFNRDGDYLDPYEITINYAPTLINENFSLIKLFVQGEATGLSAQVYDFTINNTELGDFLSDGEEGLELFFSNGTSHPSVLSISFGFSFSGGGSQERPRVQVFLGNPLINEFDTNPVIPVLNTLPDILVNCDENLIITDPPLAMTATGIIYGSIHGIICSSIAYSYGIVWMYDDGKGNTLIQEQRVVYNCFVSHPCHSDINLDGIVDAADLVMLISQYGKTSLNYREDVNKSGCVNAADLIILISAYGKTCP